MNIGTQNHQEQDFLLRFLLAVNLRVCSLDLPVLTSQVSVGATQQLDPHSIAYRGPLQSCRVEKTN